ncbi:MAG: hypothetical protein WCD44_00535, partial [Candidatus Babeliales bacterium]
NDTGLDTLYFFLEDCRCFGVNKFRELINDPGQIRGGGNVMQWEKEEDKIIIILDFLEYDEKYENAFEATLEELNCIIDQWEELLKKMPEEIVLIRDNTITNDSPVTLKENKLILE